MVQVNGPGGRAAPGAPQPSLADSESESLRNLQPLRQSVPASNPLAGSVLHPTLVFKDCLLQSQNGHWASGKFKFEARSRGRGGTRAGHPTPASQKVPCDASGIFSGYIPCIDTMYHHGMHARSVVVLGTGCYA